MEAIDSTVQEDISNPRAARFASIFTCHAYSGARLAEIGKYFGLSDSGVSEVSSKLKRIQFCAK
jgi:hypothetical protein